MKRAGSVLLRTLKVIISWQRVFLVLSEDGVLQFCEREGGPINDVLRIDAKCEVNEVSLITITNKNFGFKVSGREEYVLCTESQEELDGWVNAIRESIQQDKERQPIPQNADKNEIIICSYNINFGLCDLKQYGVYGSEEAETMCAMLSTKAHVIFLQETNDEWEKYKELIQSPVGWFPAQLVIVHTPEQDIQVLNLHLRPPLTHYPNPLPLPHAYFGSKTDRFKECLAYSSFLDFRLPLVVLGDFNEDVSAASVSLWTHKLGLKNAYDKLNARINNNANNFESDIPKSITWHWELPLNITVRAKFDHILYHGLECVQYGVKSMGKSDHYPIFAHFHAL